MSIKDSKYALLLKKVSFLYLPYKQLRIRSAMKKRIRALHIDGYSVLHEICGALGDSDIRAFCAFGTLLGIIRDKDFIESDSDMDFGIIESDDFSWSKLEGVMTIIGFKKLHQFSENGSVFEQTYHKGFIFVDFFLYSRLPNGRMVTSVSFKEKGTMYSNERVYSIMYRFSPAIDRIIKVRFKNGDVLVPENYDEYLKTVYGDSWKTPNPNYKYEEEDNKAKNVFAFEEIF